MAGRPGDDLVVLAPTLGRMGFVPLQRAAEDGGCYNAASVIDPSRDEGPNAISRLPAFQIFSSFLDLTLVSSFQIHSWSEAVFGALAAWLLSKPYITPQGLLGFAVSRTQSAFESIAQGTFATVLQSDVALAFARGLGALSNAGLGAAGAVAAATAMAIALSVWVLY